MTKCPRCATELEDSAFNCTACGLSVGDSNAETAIFSADPQANTPTRLGTPSKRNNTPTMTSGGSGRFISGTILAGRYRIVGLVGKGGMGEVYKAEDLELEQTVALKFLPEELAKNEELLRRFRGEVRNARQVSHRNVCRVFDIGETEGLYYLTMEYIDGDDLSMLLRRIGRLPSDKAVEISREICMGLAAIHKVGILHRDLKPANIIIDSKGEARITDFGIAGLEAEVQGIEARVGTPAYMSPEQADGKKLTKHSDIYSLGLLLYEIFTGRQAFEGGSVQELRLKHATTTPTNPSEIVAGIDPLVEKVINRCLEKDPKDRPDSALRVAMSLPGGDPLQVALEAGETPSPEMVAAAPRVGALKPVVAVGALISGLAMLLICLFVSMRVVPHNLIPFSKSPDVLSERANDIIAQFGYAEPPRQRFYRFYNAFNFRGYDEQYWVPKYGDEISAGQPLVFVFSEFQTPRYFNWVPSGQGRPELTLERSSGTRTISLDTRGRLVHFTAAPPQRMETVADSSLKQLDHPSAFAAAGLDSANFSEVEPEWTPTVAFDSWRAWQGVMPDHPDIPLRVEAAGFQGRIVSFQLIYPWTKPIGAAQAAPSPGRSVAVAILATLIIGMLVTAAFLARRNVKAGSADRSGAFKISLAVFVTVLIGFLLSVNHVFAFDHEANLTAMAVMRALWAAAWTWLLYLALEPIVRRRMPDLIVSWNRLLAGDFTDPLVGRDILLGAWWGIAANMLVYLGLFVEGTRLHFGPTFWPDRLQALYSPLFAILNGWGQGINNGLMTVCLFAILVLVLRRRIFAAAVIFLIYQLQFLFYPPSLIYVPFGIAVSLLYVVGVARIGMTATVAYFTVSIWLTATPLTLNFSAWYANSMFFMLFFVIALLFYGFKVSLANKPLFRSG